MLLRFKKETLHLLIFSKEILLPLALPLNDRPMWALHLRRFDTPPWPFLTINRLPDSLFIPHPMLCFLFWLTILSPKLLSKFLFFSLLFGFSLPTLWFFQTFAPAPFSVSMANSDPDLAFQPLVSTLR